MNCTTCETAWNDCKTGDACCYHCHHRSPLRVGARVRTNITINPYPKGSTGTVVEVKSTFKPFNVIRMDIDGDLGYYENREINLIGPKE